MTAQRLIAAAPIGLEREVAAEIRSLGGGIGKTKVLRGRVLFEGPPDAVYRANLRLRLADRVLLPLTTQPVPTFRRFRTLAAELPWQEYFPPALEVRFSVSARKCRLYHTEAVADAIREGMRAQGMHLPKGNGRSWGTVDVRGTEDVWTISVDSTGPSLSRRGYRQATAKAPLRENLAALLLSVAGWTPSQPLLDPMCGAGTLAIEAALQARGQAPGLLRPFAFERWPCLDRERWNVLRDQGEDRIDPEAGGASIEAADKVAGAVRASRSNSARAGTGSVVRVVRRALEATPPASGPGLVVINPPYGHRIEPGDPAAEEAAEAAEAIWAGWGRALAEARPDWDVVFFAPSERLARAFGAQGSPLARLRNGGIPVRVWRRKAGEAAG